MNLTFDLNSAAERNKVRQLLDVFEQPNRHTATGSGSRSPAKAKTPKAAKAAKPNTNGNGKTHAADVVLTVFERKKIANWSKDIIPAIERAGFSPTGAMMTKLLKEKKVKRSGRGMYQLAA